MVLYRGLKFNNFYQKSAQEYALHYALLLEGGSFAPITALIRAKADVNQPLRLKPAVSRRFLIIVIVFVFLLGVFLGDHKICNLCSASQNPRTAEVLRLLFGIQSFRHRVSPSALTLLAYHHQLATPLMLSILPLACLERQVAFTGFAVEELNVNGHNRETWFLDAGNLI